MCFGNKCVLSQRPEISKRPTNLKIASQRSPSSRPPRLAQLALPANSHETDHDGPPTMVAEPPNLAAAGADGAAASSGDPKAKRQRREDDARPSAVDSDDESHPPPLVSGLMTPAEAAARAMGELQPCDVAITERGVRRALAHRAVVEAAFREAGFISERLFDQLGVPEDKAHRASGI